MLLSEILLEDVAIDRAIIQLAKVINNDLASNNGKPRKMSSYVLQLPDVYKETIGNSLNNVSVKPYTGKTIFKIVHPGKEFKKDYMMHGVWNADDDFSAQSGILGVNKDLIGTNEGTSAIAHELRHAADDVLSGGKTIDNFGYNNPKKKELRTGRTDYTARPAEINARFSQAMEQMTRGIPIAYKKPENEIKSKLKQFLVHTFNKFEISELFPEKEKSRDYKQLMKRAMNYIQTEMNEYEQKLEAAGTPKHATGNW